MKMGKVHVDIPDEWHQELKVQVALLNTTIKKFVAEALLKELQKRKDLRDKKTGTNKI